MRTTPLRALAIFVLALSACGGGAQQSASDAGNSCTLAANTTKTASANAAGCSVLTRDASGCLSARQALGLSGAWLKFSCRVSLTSSGGLVQAQSDGEPDYQSNYFAASDACHETYTAAIQNPNTIASKSYQIAFPLSANTSSTAMQGAVVGLAINGVPIFGNFAAPGDDIYQEAKTFDRCGGHPQNTGAYHYHSEPYAISDDDANLIGMMRDGYAIYGRRDSDLTSPTLDSFGGHTAITADSASPVYHYHVNQQTSTSSGTAGQKQWFLTTGTYRGAPAACTTCN